MITKLKKVQFHKLMQLAPLISFHEPWHVRNPEMFVIRGILRTPDYSKALRYLDTCRTCCKTFGKKFQAIIIFSGRSFIDDFRCLAGF